jgi:prepilin-type N-terminal cleavage/methylation domain-containing protein
MSIKQQGQGRGFTIIEVVLVLAIAGLIFMMVFIALPALQRSQRDTQRKSDLSRAITAITNYSSSNRGNIPTTAANFTTLTSSYLITGGDSFIDPSGAGTGTNNPTATTYVFSSNTGNLSGAFASDTNQNIIYYSVGYVCGGSADTVTTTGAGARKIALRIYLEGGGFYCANN